MQIGIYVCLFQKKIDKVRSSMKAVLHYFDQKDTAYSSFFKGSKVKLPGTPKFSKLAVELSSQVICFPNEIQENELHNATNGI